MIYAFIPARSGSTRLEGKNIRPLAGLPLIGWTLHAAMKSQYINKVIFSSDSEEYIGIAKSLCEKYEKPLLIDRRDISYAGTKSKIFDYLKGELLTKLPFEASDMVVQLLPTCPLRNESHIDKAIQLSQTHDAGVFAACEYDFHVSFAFYQEKDNKWKTLLHDSPMMTGNTQSQSQKVFLHPNGSINCLPVSLLKEGHESIYYGCLPFLMKRNESVDIDNVEDFDLAEIILTRANRT